MDILTPDICVIGAGSGGLSVAAGAVQMGASVVLVEGHKMGGDCLNYGCVPSKALLAAGKRAAGFYGGAALGVTGDAPQIDYATAKDHVARVVATIEPHDSQERFEGLGVQVIRDWARFAGPREVEAGGHRIRARRFVIATGSRPFVPPIPGLAETPFLTNETLFDLREKPDHLLIIGAGPIGLEMAQAHRRLGCEVTVLEGARALGNDDPDAAANVLDRLRAEGVTIVEGAMAAQVSGTPGAITVQTQDGTHYAGSHLLIAVGRTPNTDRLNLEAAGVATNRHGIETRDTLKTTNRRIYAIGDVAGRGQFTHVAGYQAGVIIRSMLFALPAKARADHIPHVTYCDPELAQVGQTEAQARAQHGDAVQVFQLGFDANDRAQAEDKTDGLIKLMVHKGRPIGVTIAGPNAGEMIGFWALALANRLKMGAIAGTVLPYPSMGELSKRVAGAYFTPKLFENNMVKRVVRTVQRFVP